MNEAPPRVRAVARVGAGAPVTRGRPTFVPRRRPGHIGAVNVMQLVAIELVLVLIMVLLRVSLWVALTGAGVGLIVAVALFTRLRGRWWTERILLDWQYRRRRAAGVAGTADRRLHALRGLVPDLTVQSVDGTGGVPVGVGHDSAGWFAVAAVSSASSMRGDVRSQLPLDALARVVTDAEHPGGVIQVVTHTVPAPSLDLDGQRACIQSYQELLESYGPVPADQTTWVAVRLDARVAAELSADEAQEAPVMLAALVRRVGKALKRAGLPYQILDADGLLDALVRSCDLERPTEDGRPVRPVESWHAWQSATLAHACFWVRSWPELTRTGPLLDQLAASPAALTSVAMILEPEDGGIGVRCLVRVAAEPATLSTVCRTVAEVAARAGARLFRLDGEQAPAVYASAPSGGGAR